MYNISKVKIITGKRKTSVSRAVIRKAVKLANEDDNRVNQKNSNNKSKD